MARLPEVIGLLYRADWTRLSLSAELRSETDRELLPRLSASSHHDQRPSIARTSVSSAASPSADNRCASGGSPRSVHACSSVIDP
jgi:hypothetical protein